MAMAFRVILATILAAAALFGWGFLFWMVLPLGSASIEEEPLGGVSLADNMAKVLPTTGVYFIPFPPTDTTTDEQKARIEERHQEGPIVRIFYTAGGAELPGPKLMAKGFAHNLAIAFLMAVILAAAAPALPTYTKRLGVVFLIAGVAAVWLGLNEAIWFYHPWKYELYQAGYVLVGGLIMGVVMAAIIKAKPTQEERATT